VLLPDGICAGSGAGEVRKIADFQLDEMMGCCGPASFSRTILPTIFISRPDAYGFSICVAAMFWFADARTRFPVPATCPRFSYGQWLRLCDSFPHSQMFWFSSSITSLGELIARAVYPLITLARGNCVSLRNKWLLDEAIAVFRRMLALRTNHPEACYNLGSALND
jgi:hypothetical protein